MGAVVPPLQLHLRPGLTARPTRNRWNKGREGLYQKMLIQLIALILLAVGFIVATLWTGRMMAMALYNWPDEKQNRFYRKMKQISLPLTLLSIVFLLVIGRLLELNLFYMGFYLCFVPIILTIVKSRKNMISILDAKLFAKSSLNFFLVEIPLTYIYGVVWFDLFITIFQGSPVSLK